MTLRALKHSLHAEMNKRLTQLEPLLKQMPDCNITQQEANLFDPASI